MFIIPSIGNGFVDGLRQAREDNWDDAQQEQNLRIRNALANKDEATLGSDISRINAQNSYLTNEYGRNDAMNAGTFDSRLANINATNWLGADKSNRENQLGAASFPGELAEKSYNSFAQQAQAQANLQAGVPQSLAASSVGANLAKGATEYNSSRASALAGLTDSDIATLVDPKTFAANPQSATAEYAKRGIINPYNESVGYEHNQKNELTPVIYTFNANGEIVSKRAAVDHIVEGRQAGIVAATPPSVRSQEIRNQAKAGFDATNNILNGTVVGSSNGAVSQLPIATSGAAASGTAASGATTSNSSTGTPANVDTMTTGSTTPASNFTTSQSGDNSALATTLPWRYETGKKVSPDAVFRGNWTQADLNKVDKSKVVSPLSQNINPTPNGVVVPPIASAATTANVPQYVEIIRANGNSSYVPAKSVVNSNGQLLSYIPDNTALSGDAAPHSYQTAADVRKVYTPFVDNAPEYSYSSNEFNQSGRDVNNSNSGLAYAGTGISQPMPEKSASNANSSSVTPDRQEMTSDEARNWETNRQNLLRIAKRDPSGNGVWQVFSSIPYVPGYSEQLRDEIYQTATDAMKRLATDRIQNGYLFGLYHPDPNTVKQQANQWLSNLAANLNLTVARGQLNNVLRGELTPQDIPAIDAIINYYGAPTVDRFRPDLIRYKAAQSLLGGQ